MNSRKLISTLLAGTLTLGLVATTAAAEPFTGDTWESTVEKQYQVVSGKSYTDVTSVHLSWEVPVLTYTTTIDKYWDVDTLSWKSTTDTDTTGNSVSFTLTNYGSKTIYGEAEFNQNSAITEAVTVDFGETNYPLLNTIVNPDHTLKATENKEEYVKTNCQAVIAGTVSVDASKLPADSGDLGIYTVSLRNLVATADQETCVLTASTVNCGENPTYQWYVINPESGEAVPMVEGTGKTLVGDRGETYFVKVNGKLISNTVMLENKDV